MAPLTVAQIRARVAAGCREAAALYRDNPDVPGLSRLAAALDRRAAELEAGASMNPNPSTKETTDVQ